MGIKNIQTVQVGLVGVLPSIAYIYTNSTEAQVLTAGFLNQSVQEGNTFNLPCLAIVSTQASSTAAYTVGTYQVTQVGNNWSLVATSSPGSVTLPTIANHIATYVDVNGTLSENAATAINGGNIQAGLSGTAGTLASFPATASKGSLVIAGVANTGNTNTTISNDAMAQASVVNIPDPGNAIGQFVVGATATPFVSGNFPENSGTAGLMIDSGVSVASLSTTITQLGALHQVSVTLSPTQMSAAYATPVNLVANPLASQLIILHSATVYTASTGNTAYATGTAPIIQYGTGGTNGAHGVGTIATASGLAAGDITAATSQVRTLLQAATAAITGLSGQGIYFSNATNAYTGGTGTNVTFTLVYELLTATV
jgi:hypothetical protein